MSAATATQPVSRPVSAPLTAATPPPKRISWADFERRYLRREDAYKYEWVDGSVEKTKRTMDQKQYLILWNLRKLFQFLTTKKAVNGGLEAEIDTFFMEAVHRRPDISYFSAAQESRMAYGEQQVPEFVIEIISTNDQANRVVRKMQNYRDAGVRVVWQIYPEEREIHVYSGEGLMEMSVCKGQRICSAAPVLPDFQLSAEAVFQLPEGA